MPSDNPTTDRDFDVVVRYVDGKPLESCFIDQSPAATRMLVSDSFVRIPGVFDTIVLITQRLRANLHILIHSSGGYHKDASRMTEAIKRINRSGGTSTAYVPQQAYSAAGIMAVGCNNLAMLDSARLMLHTPVTLPQGVTLDDYLKLRPDEGITTIETYVAESLRPAHRAMLLSLLDDSDETIAAKERERFKRIFQDPSNPDDRVYIDAQTLSQLGRASTHTDMPSLESYFYHQLGLSEADNSVVQKRDAADTWRRFTEDIDGITRSSDDFLDLVARAIVESVQSRGASGNRPRIPKKMLN